MIVTLHYEVRSADGYKFDREPGMVHFMGMGCVVQRPDLGLPAHLHHSWVTQESLDAVNAAVSLITDDDHLLHITATAEYTAEEKAFMQDWED